MKDTENKEKYDPVKYARKYGEEHYKIINLPLKKELYKLVSDYAKANNKSIEGYIKWCIKETIKRDKEGGIDERL